jgi:hypothetical protein
VATIYCSEEELHSLARILGKTPRRVVAQCFEVSTTGILTTWPDGSLGIEFDDSHTELPRLRYLNLENSLRDVEGAWDVPKLVLNGQEAPRDVKIAYPQPGADVFSNLPEEKDFYSSLEFETNATVQTIELWESVSSVEFTADNRKLEVSSDTGVRFVLNDGTMFAFAVNESILCHVKLSFTEMGVAELLAGMSLRRTFSAETAASIDEG